jgi:hypothetical protein
MILGINSTGFSKSIKHCCNNHIRSGSNPRNPGVPNRKLRLGNEFAKPGLELIIRKTSSLPIGLA